MTYLDDTDQRQKNRGEDDSLLEVCHETGVRGRQPCVCVCVEADTPCRRSSIKGSNWVGEEFHSDRRERFILLVVSCERGRDIGGGAGSLRVKCGHTAVLISFITTSKGKVYQRGGKVQSNLVIKDNSTSQVPNWNRSVFHLLQSAHLLFTTGVSRTDLTSGL